MWRKITAAMLAGTLCFGVPKIHAQTSNQVLVGDCWGETNVGRHAKAEVLILNDNSFNLYGAYDGSPNNYHLNVFTHYEGEGSITPGVLPYEYIMYILLFMYILCYYYLFIFFKYFYN